MSPHFFNYLCFEMNKHKTSKHQNSNITLLDDSLSEFTSCNVGSSVCMNWCTVYLQKIIFRCVYQEVIYFYNDFFNYFINLRLWLLS
jgi:hypothetical protein